MGLSYSLTLTDYTSHGVFSSDRRDNDHKEQGGKQYHPYVNDHLNDDNF